MKRCQSLCFFRVFLFFIIKSLLGRLLEFIKEVLARDGYLVIARGIDEKEEISKKPEIFLRLFLWVIDI